LSECNGRENAHIQPLNTTSGFHGRVKSQPNVPLLYKEEHAEETKRMTHEPLQDILI